jgi:hypothetical protein
MPGGMVIGVGGVVYPGGKMPPSTAGKMPAATWWLCRDAPSAPFSGKGCLHPADLRSKTTKLDGGPGTGGASRSQACRFAMTNVEGRMTKARTPRGFKGRKAVKGRGLPRRPGCRDCPFRAPSGACLDPRVKSGRCGDWVWYLRGSKQHRHLYGKPNDPRTPKQLYSRDRFGAASKKYSASLTDEQQNACIAAGAKLRSRRRLGQSGPLTGQQYSIRREYAAQAAESAQSAQKSIKALRTQGILRSTSGTHRSTSVTTPGHHRQGTGRGRKDKGNPPSEMPLRRTGTTSEAGRRQREEADSQATRRQIVRRSRCLRPRDAARALRWQAASRPGTNAASRRLRRRRRHGRGVVNFIQHRAGNRMFGTVSSTSSKGHTARDRPATALGCLGRK